MARNQAAGVKLIVGLLKKGTSKPDIKVAIFSRHPKMMEDTWEKWYRIGVDRYDYKMSRKDLSNIYNLHINRYEKLYKRAKDKLDIYGDSYDEKTWKQFITHTTTALMALRKKEEMLNLHPKEEASRVVNLIINNGVMVVTGESSGSAMSVKLTKQFGELSLDEMIELRQLLKESRKTEIDGIWPTRLVKREEGETIQDIAFVEVEKEEKSDLPENVIKEMEVEKEPMVINLEEDVSILNDITKSLQQSSQDQLLALLNQKKEK